jgi:twitching motility protein PilU
VKSTCTTRWSPPSKKRRFAIVRVIDELVRQHEVSGSRSADGSDGSDREDRGGAAVLERPQVRPVVHAMRRNRVPVAMAGEEYDVMPGDLAEEQRRRRLAIGSPHDFAVGDGEGRQAGQAAAADDCEHGTRERLGGKRTVESPAKGTLQFLQRRPGTKGASGKANWYCPSNHDIIIQVHGGCMQPSPVARLERPRQGMGLARHHCSPEASQMYLDRLFKLMAEKQASDLFISCGAPMSMKINGVVMPLTNQRMDIDTVRRVAYELMNEEQAKIFDTEFEMNLSHLDPAVGNFRINIFRQRGTISLVIRYVRSDIPPFDELKLPPVLLELVMEKRGLVLIAGATGSGKSTTLAAMIDHRNTQKTGHILTIEDPIEYLFRHKKSIVNQRELSVDTLTYTKALANALREAPDLIMIGEIRDRETMQHALLHTLTGHLCLATLHANNSYHALSRIINMFPYDARSGLLSDLSIGLRAIVSQRLVRNKEGGLQPAVEILLNSTFIAELVKNGEITQIKEAMEKSLYPGSQTFEQALSRLYIDGRITYEEAMTASDSSTNLAWLINQNAPTARVDSMQRGDESDKPQQTRSDFSELQIEPGMLDRPH